jgi:hypothetical protein
MTRIPLVVFAVAVSGCIGIHVKSPRDPIPGASGAPSAQRGVSTANVARGGAYLQSQRFCRSAIPSGWIAIDYVADSGCTATKRAIDAHPVAIAVQYTGLATGTELDVCALERTPSDWYPIAWPDNDGRCPEDAPNDDPNARVLKRIRKR